MGRGGSGRFTDRDHLLDLVDLVQVIDDVHILVFIHRSAHQAGIARDHRADRHHAGRGLELFNRVIRADQSGISLKPDRHVIARLDQRQMFSLLVEQEVDDADRRFQQHLLGPLARAFFFKGTQHLQRQAVIGPDQAGAVTMGAGLGGRFQHPRTQALPRHFQQAKARDAADLNAGAVGFQLVLDLFLNREVVATLFHVDEVDHDQARKVAQTQLAGNLLGRFHVGLEGGFLDRAFLGGAARVHVDGDQRFGDADDDVTAGFQLHRGVEHAAEIAFDLKAGE